LTPSENDKKKDLRSPGASLPPSIEICLSWHYYA
jgi:hypothetical protein